MVLVSSLTTTMVRKQPPVPKVPWSPLHLAGRRPRISNWESPSTSRSTRAPTRKQSRPRGIMGKRGLLRAVLKVNDHLEHLDPSWKHWVATQTTATTTTAATAVATSQPMLLNILLVEHLQLNTPAAHRTHLTGRQQKVKAVLDKAPRARARPVTFRSE